MRKNILIISIICFLTITISYTYSAFKNTIKGTITATTNNWKFSVNVPSGVKENDYYKVFINNTSGSFDIILDNTGSKYSADYMIELETFDLPSDFVLNDSLYEGILSSESKTITVSYSSSSSANGYIKVIVKAVKAEVAFMKNGFGNSSEFWSDTYKPYIRTITFEKSLSNLPSSCTASNLCWDISEDEDQNKKVYGYLINSGEVDSSLNILYNLYIVSECEITCTYCGGLFRNFSSLVNINFNNNFNTADTRYMFMMFEGCSSLTTLDLNNFNTSNVKNMSNMFNECSSLTTLDLSGFDTSKVIDMGFMFHGCSSLENIVLSDKFETANVTSMNYMFYKCSSLMKLDLSSFDTSNLTEMKYMLSYCSSLENLIFSDKFTASDVRDMDEMFRNCSSLTELDLSSFNISKVTDMSYMFCWCTSLKSLKLGNFDTSNVKNMRLMFWNCSSLVSLDLSNFNTSKVTDMHGMFLNCSSLTTEINIMSTGITDYEEMFSDASTKSGAKIKVNYITNASSLVDNMITTKSSSSNVVKGSLIAEYTITISGNNDIKYESPNNLEGTTIKLVSISGEYLVTSFKMNGTLIEGNEFIMPNGNVTISDIVAIRGVIFETEHNPYLNSQSNVVIGEKTFEGATSLTVILDYQTESANYDYFYIYDSASSTNGINDNKKYGGSTRTIETITINGNYIKITFTSDGVINNYYGLKATVIPNY